MSDEIFSAYVASLGENGEPPDHHSYEEIREELRGVLVGELRRRGLWTAPPSFLGHEGSGWGGGALDDLVTDAYSFIFIVRLRGLRNQQRLKGNIRPMVIRNVRNFLHDLQKGTDPLGYRVFGRLREAIEQNVDRGRLFVLNTTEGDSHKLSNRSLLGFRPGLATLTLRADLEEPVQRWNDDLLPDLITAEGRAVPALVDELAEKVFSLKDYRVAAFRFGDLIAVLKDDVRKRWEGVWEKASGETARETGPDGAAAPPVSVVRPIEEPDWPHRQALIQECVAASIEEERAPKGRRDLWSLWLWIRTSRLLPGEHGPLPSFTELGRQLELTRDRVRQLFQRLWPMVQACLRSAGRRPAVVRPSTPSPALQNTPAHRGR